MMSFSRDGGNSHIDIEYALAEAARLYITGSRWMIVMMGTIKKSAND